MNKHLSQPNQNSHSRPLLFCMLLLAVSFIFACGGSKPPGDKGSASPAESAKHHEDDVVRMSEEAVQAAHLETAAAQEQAFDAMISVTGSIEANQEATQEVTPLVSGRVETVSARLGDRVSRGSVLAMIASPQIAEMHGKLHESETALAIAQRNYERVQKAENRVAVLQAKARLDEAEANLRRAKKLIELGAGAGKDLTAAETAYKTAHAEYEFQTNIALNREVAEAHAAVDTARVDVKHMRDQLAALGAPVAADEKDDDHNHDTSLIALRSPIAGTVTSRMVNTGAGVEAGKPLFVVADVNRLWVIANVPEAQLRGLRPGLTAKVISMSGTSSTNGRISYIDPTLNEETRTGRVRVELASSPTRLQIGAFVTVQFETAGGEGRQTLSVTVPEAAVQRVGERTIVFLPKENRAGEFEVRDIEIGGESGATRRVISGLKAGERVVTQGSFALKTQLMKGELEDEH